MLTDAERRQSTLVHYGSDGTDDIELYITRSGKPWAAHYTPVTDDLGDIIDTGFTGNQDLNVSEARKLARKFGHDGDVLTLFA